MDSLESTPHYSPGCLAFSFDPEKGTCFRELTFLGLLGYRIGCNGNIQSRWIRKSLGYARGSTIVLSDTWKDIGPKHKKDYQYIYPTTKDGKYNGKEVQVHQLVLKAFIGPPPNEGDYGLHWDDNRSNNDVTNLRWGGRRENAKDAIRNGRKMAHIGTKNGCAVLTEEKVLKMRKLFDSGRCKNTTRLAGMFNISQGTAWQIVHRHNWKHLP